MDNEALAVGPQDTTSALVDDDNKGLESSNETLIGPTIQAACKLVREILDQLTLKDAPPSNDADDLLVETSPTAELGIASSFETESTAIHPTAAAPSIVHSPSNHKLGHAPLTQLCTWTLEQVLGETTVPLQIETNVLLQQLSAPSPKNHNTKKRFSFWKKREEEKRDEGPRLQMFGSEYARHLSHSALAPEPPKKTSIRHRKSKKGGQYLEDADPAIQTGAVLDICVTVGEHELSPAGYHRLFMLPRKNNKNIYFHVKKEPNWDKAAI